MSALFDSIQVIQTRSALPRTARALKSGRLTLGFIGGSITADNGGNWPDPVASWFLQSFPSVRLVIENIAVGATGSDSGCLRADREIIARNCDLCFVEYAVNDQIIPTDKRSRTREGLIRKLRAAGIDVVLVYTFAQSMYADMAEGRVPASIAEFEILAAHYQLSSVWAGLHALNEVRAGRLKWHQWLPDMLHPSPRGSLSYGEAVIRFLDTAIATADSDPADIAAGSLPEPINLGHWQHTKVFDLAFVQTEGPWLLKRVHDYKHLDQVLETNAPGSRLTIPFNGRGLVLIFEYGKLSAEFRHRLDGGAWTAVERQRQDWAGDRGRVDPFLVSDELPAGDHVFEMEVIHGNRPDCAGTECRLTNVTVL